MTKHKKPHTFEYDDLQKLDLIDMLEVAGCTRIHSTVRHLECACARFHEKWLEIEHRPTQATVALLRLSIKCDDIDEHEWEAEIAKGIANEVNSNATRTNALFAQLLIDVAYEWKEATGGSLPLLQADDDDLDDWNADYKDHHPLCLMLNALDAEISTVAINHALRIVHKKREKAKALSAVFKYLETITPQTALYNFLGAATETEY